MTGEPIHIALKEMVLCAPATNYRLKSEVSIFISYVQPITQHYESRTVRKVPLQSK